MDLERSWQPTTREEEKTANLLVWKNELADLKRRQDNGDPSIRAEEILALERKIRLASGNIIH